MKTFCNFALQSTFKMNKNEAVQTLDQIKDLMTRSRKFLTLSGTTAILIGLYACVSAGIAFSLLDNGQPFRWDRFPELLDHTPGHLTELLILAGALIVLCIATAVALCWYQARKNGQRLVFDAPARRLAGSFALPLVVGGLLCLSLFRHGFYGLSSSIMLIFYGLSLVWAASHTYSSVRWLGYAEIVLGLVDSCMEGYGLVFWTLGFGVLHIVYGIAFCLLNPKK